MEKQAYSRDELYSYSTQRKYPNDAAEAAFLLGGIGTGNVSLGARGELRDWELFNSPGKGNILPYTFFAVRLLQEGGKPVSKVLEAPVNPPFDKSNIICPYNLCSLPRFEKSVMSGEYPFVKIDFEDPGLPAEVSLEAFTPFIPLNGIPCAILRYTVKNIASEAVDVTIAGSIMNAVGYDGLDSWGMPRCGHMDGNKNEFRQDGGLSGIYMYSDKFNRDHVRYGNMCLAVQEKSVTVKPYWLDGHWWDNTQDFWDDFCDDGLLETPDCSFNDPGSRKKPLFGSIGIPCRVGPGESRDFTFFLSWYFPNRKRTWNENCVVNDETPVVKNHYAIVFKDAWDAACYTAVNLCRLEEETRKFHKALFSSTLPYYVLDALASNIAVLRSPTCFWLENGSFLGWEGCFETAGSCMGSCTHVWNYAQTLAFLFPSLERSMRDIEFNMETDADGKMAFRAATPMGDPRWGHYPAADGQLGTIIRLYRDWKLSGDNDFLAKMWPNAKKALDYAFICWDSDGDFVLDSQQHNTYDIEFYGPNSMVNSMFFGALKAGSEMALAMGDGCAAEGYKKAFEEGSRRMDQLLWEGEYYIQKIDDVNQYKYQYGAGCLSDQVIGQFMSHIAGLGYILPEEHVKKSIRSVFKYNFRSSMQNHQSVQRTYALNDEKGLLLCSWPKGGRPRLPFVYSDEVWTGIEYQVAAHLIYEGFIVEGLIMVKAVRDRYDGYRRNPWSEIEWGFHYARSMASWGLLTALSGYKCDMVGRKLEFSPVINKEDFSCFWSCDKAWGVYRQKRCQETGKLEYGIEVLYGSLDGVEVICHGYDKIAINILYGIE